MSTSDTTYDLPLLDDVRRMHPRELCKLLTENKEDLERLHAVGLMLTYGRNFPSSEPGVDGATVTQSDRLSGTCYGDEMASQGGAGGDQGLIDRNQDRETE